MVIHRYEQLTLRSAALREELHTELERMLNDVIHFKVHIQGRLENYEDFLAQQVDREMEEQEQEAAEAADAADGAQAGSHDEDYVML
jgi:kinetochore protein NDC80